MNSWMSFLMGRRAPCSAVLGVVAAALAACGGTDEAPLTRLTGEVKVAGLPVEGALVVLADRAGVHGYRAVTDADGRYTMTVSNGVYDLEVDDGQRVAAAFAGPLVLSGGVAVHDMGVPDASTTAPEALSGRVLRADGSPAAFQTLRVHSTKATGPDDLSMDQTTMTDAQGEFSVTIGGRRLFDLEVLDAQGQTLEFVDVHKLAGALRVELQLANSADQQNIYRHGEAAPDAVNGAAPASVAVRIAASYEEEPPEDFTYVNVYTTATPTNPLGTQQTQVDAGALFPNPNDGANSQAYDCAVVPGSSEDTMSCDGVLHGRLTLGQDGLPLAAGQNLAAVSYATAINARADGLLDVQITKASWVVSWFDDWTFHLTTTGNSRTAVCIYNFKSHDGETYYFTADRVGDHTEAYGGDHPDVEYISAQCSGN